MSLVLLFLVPAVIGLAAAWPARRRQALVQRIGMGALIALPAVIAWQGLMLAAQGAPAVLPAVWAAVFSAPAWGAGVVIGATVIRTAE